MSSKRRVVITAIGIVSPLGNNLAETWDGIVTGRSGISRITSFDVTDYGSQIAGEASNFNPESVVPANEVKRYDRFSLLAMSACKEAWEQSGLDLSIYDARKCGVILGVGIGGLKTLETNHAALISGGPRKVSPFLIPAMISNLAPGNLAIQQGFKGVNYTVTSACTSGTHAVGEAYRMIADGLQDVVLTGGTEAAITPIAVGGFARMRALSTRNDDPQRASRPFDKDRDGFVIAEGACVLVCEEFENAKRRGANIIAEIVGYGFSCDAFHITAPSETGEGAVNCMTMAIESAGIKPEDLGYINAHGTSTPINDIAETKAIKAVFGSAANKVAVSSTKSMTGHALGAAGAIEACFLAKALHDGILPPTMNLENPEDGCDLDYIPNQSRKMQVEFGMSNSFGFGGTNASIVFKKYT